MALDNRVAVEDQYEAFQEVVNSVRGIVHWLILGHEEWNDFTKLVETYREPLRELRLGISRLLPAKSERRRYQARQERFEAAGFPPDLATELAAADYLASGMSVVDIVRLTGRSMESAARVFYAIGDLFSLGWLRDRLAETAAADRWCAVAVGGLITDLRHVQRQLTVLSLRENPTQEVTMYQFLKRERRLVERITRSIAKMRDQQRADLAAGSVVTRLLLQLLRNLERREVSAPV
jgi:glutamate dehydrogenase